MIHPNLITIRFHFALQAFTEPCPHPRKSNMKRMRSTATKMTWRVRNQSQTLLCCQTCRSPKICRQRHQQLLPAFHKDLWGAAVLSVAQAQEARVAGIKTRPGAAPMPVALWALTHRSGRRIKADPEEGETSAEATAADARGMITRWAEIVREEEKKSEEDKRSTRATRRREQRHVDSQARGIRLREAPSTSREAATAQLGNLLFRCQHCSRRFGSEHALEQHQWSSQYCAQKKGKGKSRQQCACASWITDEPRAWQQHYNASPGWDPNKKGKQIEGQQPPPLPQLLPSSSSAAVGTLPALSSLFLSLSHLTSSENPGQ